MILKAEIINIGDELLIGQVINTNAAWMAEQLSLAGIAVVRITAIPDCRKDITAALDEAFLRAELVLLTGGLGPTKDDITKHSLCEYFNAGLVLHEASLRNVEKLFAGRGLPLLEVNRRQAEVPDNCLVILNENGTAPGMWFEHEDHICISLPGVPYEMQAMMLDHVLPALASKRNGQYIIHRKVNTQGMGESMLAETISGWEDNLPPHIRLAYLPQPGIVRLRLSGTGTDEEVLGREMDKQVKALHAVIPDLIYGYDEETLEEVAGRLLKERNCTLATAESCTGGYIAHLITSVPGSSAYYKGSVIAYSNHIKQEMLGVKEETLRLHGAVSKACVLEMAAGARDKFGTDYAIAISGIAGPDGGTTEKPVGTIWIALAGPERVFSQKYNFGISRQRNIRLAAVHTLNRLRLMIKAFKFN